MAVLRREQAVRLLLPLFFVSGATALVYQTLWARQLHLVFGTSTFAIAAVLASFMAGLAIGGAWMARQADVVARPLRLYGVLEIVIGVYGAVFPMILGLLEPVYLDVWRTFEPGPLVFGGVQFALLGAALLLPTTMMGATLPLLARFATARLGAVGDRVGLLYGINTAGAVFGTWLCGFVLLPQIGLWTTTLLTAGANVLLGVIAIALDAWARGSEAVVEDDLAPNARPAVALKPVALALGLAGLASLIYEVAWTRVLVLMLGASVYAFSVMLLAFLVGIASGGVIGGRLADVVMKRRGLSGVLVTLGLVEVGVAATSYALMFVFQELPFWYVWMFDAFDVYSQSSFQWAVSLVIAGLVMTPPAVLMGIAFPLAVRAVVQSKEALGGPVGAVYAANTAGSVIGASLAGFLLLPTLGVRITILLAGMVNLLSAAVVVLWAQRVKAPRWSLAVVAAAPLVLGVVGWATPWNPLIMTAAMYKYVSQFNDHSREGILEYAVGSYELLFYEEGLSSVVTVAKNKESGSLWLANNGKVDASTNVDMPTQVLVALLPFQYVEDPEDVLVIGLASGITAGAVSVVDELGQMEIVELEPATIRAARFFDEHNHQILDDPRVEVVVNDGRNHVLLAEPESYDLIISEPSNPWISGVSNLFTQEFLEMGKTKLKPGGVWAQWVQLYGMDRDDLRSLLATFTNVYPHVVLYTTIVDADLVLVGSESPLPPGPEAVEHLLTAFPGAKEELAAIQMERPIDLLGAYLMDRDGILGMVGQIDRNTDDNMRIEYSAPLNIHRETAAHNVELLLRHAQVPPGMEGDGAGLAELARAYLRRDDFYRSRIAMGRAMDAALQADGRPEALKVLGVLRGQLQKEDWIGANEVMGLGAALLGTSETPDLELLDAFADWQQETRDWIDDVDEGDAEEDAP